MKNKAIKLAVPLLLIPSLIVSCGLINNSDDSSNPPNQTSPAPQNGNTSEANDSNTPTGQGDEAGKNLHWLPPVLFTIGGVLPVLLLLYALISLDQKNKKLNSELSKLNRGLYDLKQKGDSQNSQYQKQIGKLNDQIHSLNGAYSTKLSELQRQIITVKSQHDQNYSYLSDHIGEARNISQAQSGYGINMEPSYQPRPTEDPEDIRLLKNYYNNPQSFLSHAIRVRMTPETVNKILGGSPKNKIELDQHRTGEYFVVSGDSGQQYLLLDPKAIFNPQTLQQIKKSELFSCINNLSQSVRGEDIQIKQLAKVREDGQIWYLIESGEIKLP